MVELTFGASLGLVLLFGDYTQVHSQFRDGVKTLSPY